MFPGHSVREKPRGEELSVAVTGQAPPARREKGGQKLVLPRDGTSRVRHSGALSKRKNKAMCFFSSPHATHLVGKSWGEASQKLAVRV